MRRRLLMNIGIAHKEADGMYTLLLTDDTTKSGKERLYAFSEASLYKCGRYLNADLCAVLKLGHVYKMEGMFPGMNKNLVYIQRPALDGEGLEDVLLMPKRTWLDRGRRRAGKRK